MATATTRTIKGFKVLCPFCSDPDATVRIDLNDLQVVTCSSCDEEFTPRAAVAKLAEELRRWQAVARWVDTAAEALADPE